MNQRNFHYKCPQSDYAKGKGSLSFLDTSSWFPYCRRPDSILILDIESVYELVQICYG